MFYQDGVQITQTTADETKVAWIDSGQKLMINPAIIIDANIEVRMRYSFESSFMTFSLRIRIKQPFICSTTSFVKIDPSIKITAAVRPR